MLKENINIELKREYTDDLRKTVIAFANTNGGEIYVGLHDDGSAYGVFDLDNTMLQITNSIRDSIRPDVTLFTEFVHESIDGKDVIIVRVQRGTARPYYLTKKGICPDGVYVRQGASTVPASEAAILNMIKETSGDCFESARSINQELTFDDTEKIFQEKIIAFDSAQKRTLGIIGSDNTYTNLGLLLSEQCPHAIKLAVFEGSKKTIFKDRIELSGSILNQLEQAYRYIDRYNRTRSEFCQLDRIDMRDYPPEAIREALLNAIVHRDYSLGSPTLISIFDDRIEFINVGGLMGGVSFDDIMLGVSAPRNHKLADIFYRLKLIEAYGTGILKIKECYEEYSIKPKIEVSSNAFKIILPNTNYRASQKTQSVQQPVAHRKSSTQIAREKAVVDMFENKEKIVRKDIEKALGVSQATAILLLREMTGNGSLVREGDGKFLYYSLGDKKK